MKMGSEDILTIDEKQYHNVTRLPCMYIPDYCKSTKFGILVNLADLALGQKLNRIVIGKTSIITQNVANPPNFIAAKYCWFTVYKFTCMTLLLLIMLLDKHAIILLETHISNQLYQSFRRNFRIDQTLGDMILLHLSNGRNIWTVMAEYNMLTTWKKTSLKGWATQKICLYHKV